MPAIASPRTRSAPDPKADAAPRRVLSITGGGLLGVIPAAMLVRLERLGRDTHGPAYRLCHSFDLVGGTSTGAVIATAVALGLPADDIADFYLRDVPNGFRPRRLALPMLHDRLDDELLRSHFLARTGGRRLDRAELNCHLAIVVKNLSRSVPQAFCTLSGAVSPRMLFGAELRGDALPLDTLLRASTAVPGLYRPEVLPVGPEGSDEVCIDGGFSPFNNPAYLLARLALGHWSEGAAVTVLGTGSSRPAHGSDALLGGFAAVRLLRSLSSVIHDGVAQADTLVAALAELPGSNLSHRKHDLPLTAEAMAALGHAVTPGELRRMRAFADPRGKARLFEVALTAAERMIDVALPLTARGAAALGAGAAAAAGAAPRAAVAA